jgi:hypothetical protein
MLEDTFGNKTGSLIPKLRVRRNDWELNRVVNSKNLSWKKRLGIKPGR